MLYPTDKVETDQLKFDAILTSETLVKPYRNGLTDLSWLIKCISEPLLGQVRSTSQRNGFCRSLVMPAVAPRTRAFGGDDLLGLDPKHWTAKIKSIGNGYRRVVAEVEDLMDLAVQFKQRTLYGIGFARRLIGA